MVTEKLLYDFRKDFEEAMKVLQTKHNVVVKLGGLRYNSNSFSGRISVDSFEQPVGNVEKASFNRYAAMYGFKETDYRKRFMEGRTTYTLVGFKPSSRKYTVQLLQDNGTTIFGTPTWVKKYIKEQV